LLRRSLIAGCIAVIAFGWARSSAGAEPGVIEGHLKIASLKSVQLEDGSPSKGAAPDYASYPLLILSKDGKKDIREVIADKDGNYRVSLPPGDYVLDAKGRKPKGIRAKPRPFTIVSRQTVRVDFDLDTGVR
jgi:hypothetical protein